MLLGDLGAEMIGIEPLEIGDRPWPGEGWLRLLAEAGIPSGPINTLDRVFTDLQVVARNMVVEIDHPKVGRFRLIGNPVKTPPMQEGPFEPPPMHGQHTEEVLEEVRGSRLC